MKNMLKRISALVAVFMLSMTVSAFADGHEDIVDIAAGNPDFSILVAALTEADLVGALKGEGPFTVFAPTDAAFGDLLAALDITAEDLLGHPQLGEVLLYHVVSGDIRSTDLVDGSTAPTLLEGQSIDIGVGDGVTINDANVTAADIVASNGVIHVIDKVLVPSTFVLAPEEEEEEEALDIVGIAVGNPDFSILVAALQRADLVGALQGEGPFTVFAPTNAAFEKLLAALDISAAELLAQPDLSKVLLYHVIAGEVLAGALENGMEAPTLNGESVTFDLSGDVPKVNESGIVATDIMATNGVIHVIDTVLVPSDFELQDVDMEEEEVTQTGIPAAFPFLIPMALTAGAALLVFKKKEA